MPGLEAKSDSAAPPWMEGDGSLFELSTSKKWSGPIRLGDTSHLPFRISYCTADKMHDKVFAYIAQSQHSENLECHAFLCTKRKMVSRELGAALGRRQDPKGTVS